MICWIVRLWSKHRLLAVGCVDRRTQPTAVAYDVDVIPSIVMSLISHVSRYCTTDSLRQIVQVQLAADPFATVRTRLPLTSSIFIAISESHFRFDPVALPISRRNRSGTNGGVVICMHGQQKSNGCSLRLCHQPDLRLQHHPLVSLDSAYDPIARFTTNRRQQPDDHEGAGRHVGRKRCYGLCNLEPMVRQTAYSSSESVAGAAPRRWRGCSLCLLEAEPLREAPEC